MNSQCLIPPQNKDKVEHKNTSTSKINSSGNNDL